MPAALLEILPELALGLLLLASFLSYGMGRGTLVLWDNTFGHMLRGIGGFLNFSVTVLHKHIGFDFGHVFYAADTGTKNAIGHWIETSEEGMARSIRAMTAVWKAGIVANEWLAKETALTFEWLLHVHLPRWAKAALFPILWPILLPQILRAVLPHLRGAVAKPIKVIERGLPQQIIQVFKYAGAATLPGVIGLPKVWKEIHGLTRRNLRISKRLHKIEGLFGAVAFAGLMANALGLGSNWRCITRGNIGRVARRLCGLGPAALEDLLGLLADVLILQNICTVITVLEDGFKLIEPEMTDFIKTAETQFVHCKYHLPTIPAIALPYLPPVTGVVLNQAA